MCWGQKHQFPQCCVPKINLFISLGTVQANLLKSLEEAEEEEDEEEEDWWLPSAGTTVTPGKNISN
jgi:hypothetical protein